MFSKKLRQQSAGGIPIPECYIQFAVAEEGSVVQIARANSSPLTINYHEFGMNPNGLSLAVTSQSCNPSERESLEVSQCLQLLGMICLGGRHYHNLDTPLQSLSN